MTGISITAVAGLPEVTPGADLPALVEAAEPDLRDGDILVVTSKVISKAEGRLVQADRDQAIDAESVRMVARRGQTRIVQTRHGLVLAAAGVDNSNTPPGTVALLPEDPDASARRLRKDLAGRLGVRIAVIITDTLGRPWRTGQVDAAIGVAGLWSRSRTTAVRRTRSGTCSRSRWPRWPMRSPPPPTWSRERRTASPRRWSGAWTAWSPPTTGLARPR